MKDEIIEVNQKKFMFCLVEDLEMRELHPVSDYYTKLDDLSINLILSLKWIKWGYFFFSSLCENLDSLENHSLKEIISKSIQEIQKNDENIKIILIDDLVIKDKMALDEIIKDRYSNEVFNKNTKIHMKLKMNLREYLIITNMLYPTILKFKLVD